MPDPRTTYRIHDTHLPTPVRTRDASQAEWAARAGFRVTAVTRGAP